MPSQPERDLKRLGCEVLEESEGGRVVIERGIRREFDVLEPQKEGRLRAVMKGWCDQRKLTPEMFNPNEGRTSRHGAMLQAFKMSKVRLYGVFKTIGGVRTFAIVDIDPAKKQNRADQKVLKRARRRADELLDKMGDIV